MQVTANFTKLYCHPYICDSLKNIHVVVNVDASEQPSSSHNSESSCPDAGLNALNNSRTAPQISTKASVVLTLASDPILPVTKTRNSDVEIEAASMQSIDSNSSHYSGGISNIHDCAAIESLPVILVANCSGPNTDSMTRTEATTNLSSPASDLPIDNHSSISSLLPPTGIACEPRVSSDSSAAVEDIPKSGKARVVSSRIAQLQMNIKPEAPVTIKLNSRATTRFSPVPQSNEGEPAVGGTTWNESKNDDSESKTDVSSGSDGNIDVKQASQRILALGGFNPFAPRPMTGTRWLLLQRLSKSILGQGCAVAFVSMS